MCQRTLHSSSKLIAYYNIRKLAKKNIFYSNKIIIKKSIKDIAEYDEGRLKSRNDRDNKKEGSSEGRKEMDGGRKKGKEALLVLRSSSRYTACKMLYYKFCNSILNISFSIYFVRNFQFLRVHFFHFFIPISSFTITFLYCRIFTRS